MSEPTGLPSFDVDTTKDFAPEITENKTKKRSIHTRELGISGDYLCREHNPPLVFKANRGLQSHITYIHKKKKKKEISTLYNSDVIQLGFETKTRPIYDDKNKVWIYPHSIKIPNGFVINHIDTRINIVTDTNLQPIDLLKITCIKKTLEVSK